MRKVFAVFDKSGKALGTRHSATSSDKAGNATTIRNNSTSKQKSTAAAKAAAVREAKAAKQVEDRGGVPPTFGGEGDQDAASGPASGTQADTIIGDDV
jgi:hypothetical protein